MNKQWSNDDLVNYYNNFPTDNLKKLPIIGGFASGEDVKLILPCINMARTILEVGAGYGRVVNHILESGYTGKITAIERCKKLYDYMKMTLPSTIKLIHGDVRYHQFQEKFDLILLMWSNISEYHQANQLKMVRHYKALLKKRGVLILETIDHTLAPKNSTQFKKQEYIVESEYGIAYGYVPSSKQIDKYAKAAGFIHVRHLPYKTQTNRKRFIHLLTKN